MGSSTSTTVPNRQTITETLFGSSSPDTFSPVTGQKSQISGVTPPADIPFGKEIFDDLYAGYKTGLPDNLKKLLMSRGQAQLGASLQQGKQDLNESVAGLGGIPTDALLSAQNKLRGMYSKGIKELNEDIAFKDYDAKNDNYNRILQLYGLASGRADSANSFNLNKYNIDRENEFSWGDALGGGLGLAGTIGGAGISRKGRNKKNS